MVKTMQYKQVSRTARSAFKTPVLSTATLNALTNKIHSESQSMCKNLTSKSLFKSTTRRSLTSRHCTWSCTYSTCHSQGSWFSLKQAKTSIEHDLNGGCSINEGPIPENVFLLQTLVGSILYSGHASKRLRHLNSIHAFLIIKLIIHCIRSMHACKS